MGINATLFLGGEVSRLWGLIRDAKRECQGLLLHYLTLHPRLFSSSTPVLRFVTSTRYCSPFLIASVHP